MQHSFFQKKIKKSKIEPEVIFINLSILIQFVEKPKKSYSNVKMFTFAI